MSDLLTERIAVAAHRDPHAVAVRAASDRVHYGEFWRRVTRTAAGLRGMRRVAVLPTSDIESLVIVTAAMRAGVAVVLLHRHLLATQLARVLDLARPGAVVAAPRQHARLRRLGHAHTVTAADLESDGTPESAHPDSELLVGITSGTTGEPKLFVRDQKSWAATLDRSDQVFDIAAGDRVSVPGVLDHTHFLYGALHALTRGASVDLRPVTDALGDGATHLYSVPTIAWDVVRGGGGPFPLVREVLSSAARWPRAGREALRQTLPNATLTHFYGASELSFVSFDRGVDDRSAGQLFDGVDAEIRDGSVYVRSDMLFDGYLTDSGRTGGPVDGWMTVGDRGEVDGRALTLFGRASEMLIRAGLNVEPAEVESALTALPGIGEAACIGIPDPRMGEVPVAAIVVDGDPPPIAEIWRHLRATVPTPSMPVRVLPVASLPRTPRGKLDKRALREIFSTATESDGPR
ncbi:class I adenylate-forming enzyme family protein [Nocardia bovistercoris]|uniref:AMP-binding protein n=1 Tax=Nocardia bovistercoris TaxID=2785916 RepID=A0A931N2B8_9NOCA|nr:AMP-binding protein [Nocardia bovistercoris]MBH0779330.1 AMP-binding protein [Nocardia bovistercoris]